MKIFLDMKKVACCAELQAGVFVSRSSVQLVQIRKVHIISLLQLANMLLWLIDVHVRLALLFRGSSGLFLISLIFTLIHV